MPYIFHSKEVYKGGRAMVRDYVRRERCRGCDFAAAQATRTVCDAASQAQIETMENCPQGKSLLEHVWTQLVTMEKETQFWHQKIEARF